MKSSHLGPARTGACIALVLGTIAVPALAADLVLKRVMLSTGGVGYFEYEAEVTGDAELVLDVPLDQVDDVLKSIVVYDSKGGVGSASLAGRDPLSQVFKDLPFDEAALASPAALLQALRGAEIKVGSTHPITGKLLAVANETITLANDATTTRARVSVMTATGLQQFILEEAESVSFVDPDLQAKVDKALAALAAQRAKERRQIALTTKGSGARAVRVGYVVAAPLWKASYRMSLPQSSAADKARLQGWAVLENMSGHDWKDVELTLLSGNPVSFRQAIYDAYYVTRPELPVEVSGRILPRPDSGVMGDASRLEIKKLDRRFDRFKQPDKDDQRDSKSSAATAAGAPAQPMSEPKPAAPIEIARAAEIAESVDAMTQVSFRLPTPVTIASGRSAIVPLFDQELPMTRLVLLQPPTSLAHPLASLRLKNTSASGLPPGVLTLYEETGTGVAYIGDARLGGLPAGEERLLSYAVDEKTKVSREEQSSSTYTKGSIAQGVLYLTQAVRSTTTYKVSAPVSEPRHALVEQMKREGWRLVEPAGKSVEETATPYRAALDLKSGEGKSISFVLETPAYQSVRVADINDEQFKVVMASREIDAAVKNALTELARLRRIVSQKRAAEEQVKGEIEALRKDQERIRENLARINQGSALYKRYVDKLTEQETRFEELQAAVAKAAEETRMARAAIDAYVTKLSI